VGLEWRNFFLTFAYKKEKDSMIHLQTFGENGRICPKCGQGSVFTRGVYKWFGFVYKYTEHKCAISECGYEAKIYHDYKEKCE
jgi:hypothetical protein